MNRLTDEQTAVKDLLSRLTGAPFEITKPDPRDILNNGGCVWSVSCDDLSHLYDALHVQRVWADLAGAIWLRSNSLGNVVDWTEEFNGDVVAAEVSGLHFTSLKDSEARKKLATLSPRTEERIKAFELIVERRAERYDIHMVIDFGITAESKSLVLTSNFDGNKIPIDEKLALIRKNVAAMKDSCENMLKLYGASTSYTIF